MIIEVYIIGFILLAVLFVILSFVWPPDSPWSPWWKTSRPTSLAAAKLAGLKDGEVVYELGSGDGEFLLAVASSYKVKLIGIEIDPARVFVSWIRRQLSKDRKKIQIVRKDFKKVSVKDADFVFVYLVPRALGVLYPKLKKELKKGSRVVSYIYEIPGVKYTKKDTKNKLFLYKIT